MLQIKCHEFEKPEFFRRVAGELVGVGLLFTEGEEHKMQKPPPLLSKHRAIRTSQSKVKPLHPILFHSFAVLGVELDSLASSSSLAENYDRTFNQPPLGQAISALNMFVPVRKWLPLKAK